MPNIMFILSNREKNHNLLLFTTSNERIWPKKNFDFHACILAAFENSEKLPKWHFFTHE